MIFSICVLGGVIVLMIILLVAPETVNNILRSRIEVEARTRLKEPESPHFAAIMIFLVGCAFFFEIGRGRSGPQLDRIELLSSCTAALFLLFVGISGCYFPIRFMRTFVARLREVPVTSLDNRSLKKIEMCGRTLGACFLLGASFVTYQVFASLMN